MIIKNIIVGELKTNCYVLQKNNEVLIIDPGDEAEKIIKAVGNAKVIGILITHDHLDHIKALPNLLKKYRVNFYDYHSLFEGENHKGSFKFTMIRTPGHTDDSISIYFKEENILFCGDFIFKNSIGRWDLPSGNVKDLKNSIQKILKYPPEMKIYPGHGDTTFLTYEINNLKYYLQMF